MFVKSSLTALALAAGVWAKELPKDEIVGAALYDSGIMHKMIMDEKEAFWEELSAQNVDAVYPAINTTVACTNGLATVVPGDASQTFRCKNIDLYSFLSHGELGSQNTQGSSSWGWTSQDGREFVAIGQNDGTAFAEISKEGRLIYLGRLPFVSSASNWREIRSWKNYMVIGSEAVGHGIQFFDMTRLLDIDPASPVTFHKTNDLAGYFNGLPNGRTHNVVTNEDTNFVYAVGAQPTSSACRSGIIFIDVSDISNPTSPGCASADGYVHDAQCVIYHGPDKQYEGREICYGYNEDTLTIYDVTDKKAPKILSRTSYEGASYTHQGWVLDKSNQKYLILDDEYDEVNRKGPAAAGYPITYIWDISSLAAPKQTGYYRSGSKGIDHNQYIVDGLAFQSNYAGGLRVLDVSSIPSDPTGAGVEEIAFFDIYPEDDNNEGGGQVIFAGSWSSYAYFKSGYILINTMSRGAFIVKMKSQSRVTRY